ncbi:MAG: hypothetical protein RR698_20690, partial [Stenotrophomonas sp.]
RGGASKQPDLKNPQARTVAESAGDSLPPRGSMKISLKSGSCASAVFHRIEEIQCDRFTRCTVGLYDLCTACGRIVDKKAGFPHLKNYPQLPTQAERLIYRGFHPYKIDINQ